MMNELALKYGCNPNQAKARIYMANGAELPIKVLNGRPGYINFLDAFNKIFRCTLGQTYIDKMRSFVIE